MVICGYVRTVSGLIFVDSVFRHCIGTLILIIIGTWRRIFLRGVSVDVEVFVDAEVWNVLKQRGIYVMSSS